MLTTTPPLLSCSPAWATRRNPERRTDGADVAATARVLGVPLIPWQQLVADVLGELDDRGRYWYLIGVVIVPRRAGKTHVALTRSLTMTRRRRRSKAFYALHRRETAAAMWRDDWFPLVEESPLCKGRTNPWIGIRRANGSEAMTWRHSKSVFRLLPPDGNAMRSFKSDLANIDEGREFTLAAGMEFEAACFPTQRTGLGGQTVIMSNAGTATSDWLARWRDLGRAATTNPQSRIAYFEWAAPLGADPYDDATLIAAHPGLGYHVDLDAIRADREIMAPDDFASEYLGWWPETQVDTELLDAWLGCVDETAAPADPVVFGVELDVDRTRTQIVAVGRDRGRKTGTWAVELLVDRPHGDWVGAELDRLAVTHHPLAIVWDRAGPVAALAHDLDAVRANLTPMTTADVAAAAGGFHDACLAGALTHRPDDVLDAAIVAARRRPAGGSWLYDRRQPGAGPLIAASLALWQARSATSAPPSVR